MGQPAFLPRGRFVFFEEAALGEEDGAQFLIVPEDIALRMILLGEQAVDQPRSLHSLGVIDGFHLDAGFLFERAEDGFREGLIEGAINDHFRGGESGKWKGQREQDEHG